MKRAFSFLHIRFQKHSSMTMCVFLFTFLQQLLVTAHRLGVLIESFFHHITFLILLLNNYLSISSFFLLLAAFFSLTSSWRKVMQKVAISDSIFFLISRIWLTTVFTFSLIQTLLLFLNYYLFYSFFIAFLSLTRIHTKPPTQPFLLYIFQ